MFKNCAKCANVESANRKREKLLGTSGKHQSRPQTRAAEKEATSDPHSETAPQNI